MVDMSLVCLGKTKVKVVKLVRSKKGVCNGGRKVGRGCIIGFKFFKLFGFCIKSGGKCLGFWEFLSV